MRGHIYVHSPCFDGIASAVLAWDYLECEKRWRDVSPHEINYHLRDRWLQAPLAQPAAVVDFLYHPDAEFWADHHATTFLTAVAEADYEARRSPTRVYSSEATSCAKLLDRWLSPSVARRDRSSLVAWADAIDSARYESPEEAIYGDAAALRIKTSLELPNDKGYPPFLERELRHRDLEEVARQPEVERRYLKVRGRTDVGLKRFRESASVNTHGIVVFDVDGREVCIPRDAPFYFHPNARYSVGIVRRASLASLTTMRNPWLASPGVHLGRICEPCGGGGHQRVAGVMLQNELGENATEVLAQVVSGIVAAEDSSASK